MQLRACFCARAQNVSYCKRNEALQESLVRKMRSKSRKNGTTQSLVATKKQLRPAIKQENHCDGFWRDRPWSSVGAISPQL